MHKGTTIAIIMTAIIQFSGDERLFRVSIPVLNAVPINSRNEPKTIAIIEKFFFNLIIIFNYSILQHILQGWHLNSKKAF